MHEHLGQVFRASNLGGIVADTARTSIPAKLFSSSPRVSTPRPSLCEVAERRFGFTFNPNRFCNSVRFKNDTEVNPACNANTIYNDLLIYGKLFMCTTIPYRPRSLLRVDRMNVLYYCGRAPVQRIRKLNFHMYYKNTENIRTKTHHREQ
jgi:hypothetical protein